MRKKVTFKTNKKAFSKILLVLIFLVVVLAGALVVTNYNPFKATLDLESTLDNESAKLDTAKKELEGSIEKLKNSGQQEDAKLLDKIKAATEN